MSGGVHEYSPVEFTMMSMLGALSAPLLPALLVLDGVLVKERPFGGWTAYTTVVGLSPVVTYVAMNG